MGHRSLQMPSEEFSSFSHMCSDKKVHVLEQENAPTCMYSCRMKTLLHMVRQQGIHPSLCSGRRKTLLHVLRQERAHPCMSSGKREHILACVWQEENLVACESNSDIPTTSRDIVPFI